jgi:hypothetical protein
LRYEIELLGDCEAEILELGESETDNETELEGLWLAEILELGLKLGDKEGERDGEILWDEWLDTTFIKFSKIRHNIK